MTTHFCGQGNRGNVFFGLGENHYDDIHRVLYKAARPLWLNQGDALEVSRHIAAFSFCGQHAAFLDGKKTSRYFRDFKRRLVDSAPESGWALIILDPVSRLLGADAEIDNASATQFISLQEELTIDLPGNPTVLFAHHVSKAAIKEARQDQSAARGSSALTDGVRLQFNLTKEGEDIIFKVTKTNFTPLIKDQKLQKDNTGVFSISKKKPELF